MGLANMLKSPDKSGLKNPLGMALKTIAVMDCDWDNGKDRFKDAREFMGEALFDFYKNRYPEKYRRLVNECR